MRHYPRVASKLQWPKLFFSGSLRLICAGLSLFVVSATAQVATVTSVSSSLNPSRVADAVTFTATVGPAAVTLATAYSVSFTAKVGAVTGGIRYYRFEFGGGATLATTLTGASFTNSTPSAFGSTALELGGSIGQNFAVFSATGGTATISPTDVLVLDLPGGSVSPVVGQTPTVTFTVHETLTAALDSTSAFITRDGPLALAAFASPSSTGEIDFRSNGTTITGCGAVALVTGVASCTTTFTTAGTRTITANYTGNNLASTGTLSSGQLVGIVLGPSSLAAGTFGVPYTATSIVATGGVAPFTFAVTTGALPGGMAVSNTGSISGTPTAAGVFSATITATDATGTTASISYTITINKVAQSITFSLPISATVSTSAALTATASSGLAVAYQVTNSSICTAAGSTVSFLSIGTCTILATQAGNTNYVAAPNVTVNVSVVTSGGPQPLRLRSSSGQSLRADLLNNQLVFTATSDPGSNFSILGNADIDGNGRPDLVFQNNTQGEFGEVRFWSDYLAATDSPLRTVRRTWELQAVGDLDGDGRGDLVWRFIGQSPNAQDIGVSYIWFTNGTSVTQVRKRGGAPLNWQLLGAADVNKDKAADMFYVGSDGEIRVLIATPNRTCANFFVGYVPLGYTAMKVGDFTGNKLAEVFIREIATGQNRVIALDATTLTLPSPTGNPDDANAACTSTSQTVPGALRLFFAADVSWQYFASVDLNGDGILDIVWLKPGGTLAVWLMTASLGIPTVLLNAGTLPAGFSATPLQ